MASKPVSSYLQDLKVQQRTLAQNLNAKGVSANETELFNTLVPKVLDITGGGAPSTDGWQRPLSRPTAPTFSENEQTIYFLFGVGEYSPNDMAFNLSTSTGQYAVDWGDGVITNHNSATTAEYIYDYNLIGGTATSEGYKWVWIKVYPLTGNLTIINLAQYRHSLRPTASSSNIYVPQVFEVYIQAPYVTSMPFYSNRYTRYSLCDSFNYIGTNLITSFTYFLYQWSNLKQLNIDTSNGTIFSSFLHYCSSFNQPLNINTSNGTIFSNFLNSCSSFNQPLTINTSNGTDFGYFLNSCSSFNQPLNINISNGTAFVNFLYSCSSYNQPLTINLQSATMALGTNFIGAGNFALKSLRLLNMGLIHTALTISNSSLDVDALVTLFGDLPDRTATTSGTITITNVYGASRLTATQRSIATAKGWVIVG